MRLVTGRTILRRMDAVDAPFVLRLLNEPDFLRFIGDRGVRTLDDARAYIERGSVDGHGTGFGLLLVERASDGEPLGMCGLMHKPWLPGPDLAYAFLPEARGQGYAIEAARAVIDHGRRTLRVDPVFAVVLPANVRSTRLLRALGFVPAGTVVDPRDGTELDLYTATEKPDMDARIRYLDQGLRARRAQLLATVEATPLEVRSVAPAADAWSVAAVLEHLVDTERLVTQLLAGMLPKATPRAAAEPFEAEEFAAHVDLPALLDRGRRFRGMQPAGSMTVEAALAGLDVSRRALLDTLARADGLRLEALTYAHPFVGELDLYQWIAFVGLHEARHAAQIREIAERLAIRPA